MRPKIVVRRPRLRQGYGAQPPPLAFGLPAEALAKAGGEGWIRTSVRLRGQIYSLLPLTTRPPLHEVMRARMLGRRAMWRRGLSLSTREDALSPRELALACAPNFNSPPDCRNLERVKGIEPSS